MSLLAIVTFDLHGASPNKYPRVKRKLSRLRLKKQILAKDKDTPTRLPANTFAAKFSSKWNNKEALILRDHLCNSVCEAIRSLHLHATVLVAVCDGWAWGKRSVSPQSGRRKSAPR
jgi:hypothetical protein